MRAWARRIPFSAATDDARVGAALFKKRRRAVPGGDQNIFRRKLRACAPFANKPCDGAQTRDGPRRLARAFFDGGATAAFRPNFAPRRRRDAGAHSGMPVLPSGWQRWDEQTPWREERNRDASASGAQTRRDLPGAFVARRTTPTRPPGRGGALSKESAVTGKGEDAQFGRAGTPEACLRRAPCSRTLRRQRPRNCSRMQRRLADAFKMRRIAAARARKENARAFDGRGGALSRGKRCPGEGGRCAVREGGNVRSMLATRTMLPYAAPSTAEELFANAGASGRRVQNAPHSGRAGAEGKRAGVRWTGRRVVKGKRCPGEGGRCAVRESGNA